MFIRALVVSLALGALWWSGSSFGLGLGLGDIRIESTLASPLKASIPLRGLAEIDLDLDQFSISIDSDARAEIRHRLERIDADTATLILYTREPMTEPLLQFRVEVEWDRRTVARSYDVFIDPAVYAWSSGDSEIGAAAASVDSPAAAQNLDAPAEQRGEDSTAQSADAGAVDPAIRRILQAAQESAAEETRREYGPTIDGNSIWRVARAVATDNPDFNIYQWMYATWQANPHAFFGGNMHRLKMNELLVVPLEREVARVSRGEAWRAYSAQLALLQNDGGATSGATLDEGEAVKVDGGTRAEAMPEAVAAASGPPAGMQEKSEIEQAANEQISVEAAEAEQTPAAPATDDAATGETPLSKVIAMIEEVEREQASIVINRDGAGETAAEAETPVILDRLEGAQAWSSASVAATPARPHGDGFDTIAAARPVAIEADEASARSVASGQPLSGWRARREMFEQLPLIGAEAPLALVGRALQKTDEYVATSPSWAALAFGGWIAVVVMMLLREWRARLGAADATPRPRAVTVARVSPAPAAGPFVARPVTLQPAAYKPPIKLPTGVEKKSDRPEPRIDYNADEILAKADSFMQARDTDEAVKLLELAIKLQPERIVFVVRLLQIFHQLKRAGDFDSLLRRFRPALLELEREQQEELQAMHKRLCPRAKPVLGEQAEPETDEYSGNVEFAQDEIEPAAGDGDEETDAESPDSTTEVTFMSGGQPSQAEATVHADADDGSLDLEEMLNEVDVYLAYGLYDNAEELLLQGMEAEPNRVDYLAKLLDTYYATKNLVDFVTCAEALRDMGEEANNEYWDKVEVMGYELAPYNELFAGGRNRSLHGSDLEIRRPAKTDIDTGDAGAGDDELAAAHAGPADPAAAVAIEDSQDLDLELDAEAGEEPFTIEDGETDPALTEANGSRTDELVAELLAEEDEDPTNLNFSQDATSNVTFAQDAPLVLDQVDDDERHDDEVIDLEATFGDGAAERLEGEAADLVADLEQEDAEAEEAAEPEADIGEDLVFATDEINLDYDDVDTVDDDPKLDNGTNETMKFTIAGDNEFEQRALAEDTDSLEDLRGEIGVRDADGQSTEGRILLFPEGKPGRQGDAEFEAEVKMTLQAIRDQLQYLTERVYRQERESCDIRQALSELHEHDAVTSGAAKKKSS